MTISSIFKLQYLLRNQCSLFAVFIALVCMDLEIMGVLILSCFSFVVVWSRLSIVSLNLLLSSNWTARKVIDSIFGDSDLMSVVWSIFVCCLLIS